MKALTDKIIQELQKRIDAIIIDEETGDNAIGLKNGLLIAIKDIQSIEADAQFEEVARTMIKHLNSRNHLYHPHHLVIIDCTRAELLEGKQATAKIMEYIKG